MPTITDRCDACAKKVEWTVERDLRHGWCPQCGTRHIISLGEDEAFEHRKRSLEERRERFDELEPLDEIMGVRS